MTRIFLNGCCGRMGRAISAMALESDDFEVVAGADIVNNNGFAYPVFESLDKCDVDFDAIIDFSNAKGVPALSYAALQVLMRLHLPSFRTLRRRSRYSSPLT